MLTSEQSKQFGDILEELGKTLDITKSQHDAAVTSYQFVGDWLAREGSPLAKYLPEILPQGSFLFGTMTRPENENDELDIDVVCRFEGKQPEWTQFDLKNIVGNRLKGNETIKKLLVIPDGRRCWTLRYADASKFHVDILPSLVSSGYKLVLEKSLRTFAAAGYEELAIRITDKEESNYRTAIEPEAWLKSNPFGYGIWFERQASLTLEKSARLSESVQPVPAYGTDKLPLQRVVQILKRHRDMMFNGDKDKPISIIITTLAAMSYAKETNVSDALVNVVRTMPTHIGELYSPVHRKVVKHIPNPVNLEENFADKWPTEPQKEANFYKWMGQVAADIDRTFAQTGMDRIRESLEKPFGKNAVIKAFSNYGDNLRRLRETGALKMAAVTGVLGNAGSSVKEHSFHGR
ncbi:MAG: nucleotidyltransferase [Ignavibacteriales bacterium]|nr:nucleotidyltransferase [Ignavibacteriales bacterium]